MFSYTKALAETNCTDPAIDDFPGDGLDRMQRQEGYVAIHTLIALYIFVMLAIVCDEYFVPAVERLCVALNMSTDIAGATFMAAATSAPELFVNIIGTFITEGDLGIGTIVGSAVFNTLGVAAVCGILSGVTIKLDWWPMTRDCSVYAVTVCGLICILWDSVVMWYEALALVIAYFFYILIMYNDKRLQKCAKESATCQKVPCFEIEADGVAHSGSQTGAEEMEYDETSPHLCKFPSDENCILKIWWLIKFPTYLVYFLTIPDCRKPNLKKLFPISFIMCCVWISMLSYFVSWMITTVGDTFRIPDSVMGITFLAVGTSIPEAVSSIIVARRGYGSMAICNSIGSNTFDVLLCLGLPWLIKTSFFPQVKGLHRLEINSSGLVYSTLTLLSTLIMLYVSFACTKFTLGRTVGCACFFLYMSFVVFACLMEMNVFFIVNLPPCFGSMAICYSMGSNTFDVLLCLGLPWLIKTSFFPQVKGLHRLEINSSGLVFSIFILLSTLIMMYVSFACTKFTLGGCVGCKCFFLYMAFIVFACLMEMKGNLPPCE